MEKNEFGFAHVKFVKTVFCGHRYEFITQIKVLRPVVLKMGLLIWTCESWFSNVLEHKKRLSNTDKQSEKRERNTEGDDRDNHSSRKRNVLLQSGDVNPQGRWWLRNSAWWKHWGKAPTVTEERACVRRWRHFRDTVVGKWFDRKMQESRSHLRTAKRRKERNNSSWNKSWGQGHICFKWLFKFLLIWRQMGKNH